MQVIGNGKIFDHEGLVEATLKHPSHKTFHKTTVSPEDEAKGITRFYRWHIDAALYDLSPPRVTTLYGLEIPQGPTQVCRYDDGTWDELPVTLGTTAFVSGKTMFRILPDNLKSVAVRAKVKYAPHPYVWMAPARAKSTGLGIECEGLEMPFEELPPWEEGKRKTFPMVRIDPYAAHLCLIYFSQLWKNPVTDELSFQVHPCGSAEIIVDALPEGAKREGALYPDGAHLTDLEDVRGLLYKMQRPAIAPTVGTLNSGCIVKVYHHLV